jgi:hypothetical protein
MKRISIALLLMAAAALAQDKPKDEQREQKIVQRLFILKYADPQQIYDVIRVFGNGSGGGMVPNREMHSLTVSAAPETVAAIEDALKRLDVPAAAAKDIDLTAYLVLGADGPDQAGGALPKDLDNVVAQLHNTFAFKNYGPLDTIALRLNNIRNRATTTSSGGALTVNGRLRPVVSDLVINSIRVGGDGATISIENLGLTCHIPDPAGENTNRQLSLQTSLDMKEGQKVVVGRMGVNQGQALFLVLIAKIL